jgi:hypothetical protein
LAYFRALNVEAADFAADDAVMRTNGRTVAERISNQWRRAHRAIERYFRAPSAR